MLGCNLVELMDVILEGMDMILYNTVTFKGCTVKISTRNEYKIGVTWSQKNFFSKRQEGRIGQR